MDWLNIIITAGVASIITLAANLIIQGSQYKKDFYRKIVDKRIEAYTELEKLINKMSTNTTAKNGKECLSCLHDKQNYENLINEFASTFACNLWFNIKTTREIMRLHTILNQSIGMLFENMSDEEIQSKGINNYSNIVEQRFKVAKFIYDDLSEIYKVKKFLKEKQNQEIDEMTIYINIQEDKLKNSA